MNTSSDRHPLFRFLLLSALCPLISYDLTPTHEFRRDSNDLMFSELPRRPGFTWKDGSWCLFVSPLSPFAVFMPWLHEQARKILTRSLRCGRGSHEGVHWLDNLFLPYFFIFPFYRGYTHDSLRWNAT